MIILAMIFSFIFALFAMVNSEEENHVRCVIYWALSLVCISYIYLQTN